MPTEESVRKDMEEDREENFDPENRFTDLNNAWRNGFRQGWYAGTSRIVTEINEIIGQRFPNYLG